MIGKHIINKWILRWFRMLEILTQKEKQRIDILAKIVYNGCGLLFFILGLSYSIMLLVYCIQQFLQGNW